MSRRAIEGSYARLCGLRDALALEMNPYVSRDYIDDYQSILGSLRQEVDDEFSGFDLPRHVFTENSDPEYQADRSALRIKFLQIISYLESVHRASNRIVEIGSVYNLIKDEVLKSRCSDLLSANGHFDRVINQATQVLEERIRSKLPDLGTDGGSTLVGKAINNNPDKTRLRFSNVGARTRRLCSLI